jgi:hypothetical protein
MTRHIHVKEAVYNAVRSLRETEYRGTVSDTTLANANRECAIRNGHKKAADFWTEVVKFCKTIECLGPGTALHVKPYHTG